MSTLHTRYLRGVLILKPSVSVSADCGTSSLENKKAAKEMPNNLSHVVFSSRGWFVVQILMFDKIRCTLMILWRCTNVIAGMNSKAKGEGEQALNEYCKNVRKESNNRKNPCYNTHAACNNKLVGQCICSFNDSFIQNYSFLILLKMEKKIKEVT